MSVQEITGDEFARTDRIIFVDDTKSILLPLDLESYVIILDSVPEFNIIIRGIVQEMSDNLVFCGYLKNPAFRIHNENVAYKDAKKSILDLDTYVTDKLLNSIVLGTDMIPNYKIIKVGNFSRTSVNVTLAKI